MVSTRRAVQALAGVLILVGLFYLAQFGWDLWHSQDKDKAQSDQWRQLVGAAAGPADASSLPGDLYMRLIVPKLNKDGVAINSDWTGLQGAGMVHYKGSPPPGQKGNVLVAFHRETHWMDINQLGSGDQVQIETVDKNVFRYRIDFVRLVSPDDVSWLRPTDGSDLTMITCDPPWQDYKRLIYRAHLEDAKAPNRIT